VSPCRGHPVCRLTTCHHFSTSINTFSVLLWEHFDPIPQTFIQAFVNMKIAPTLPISLLPCIPFSLAFFDFGSPGILGDLIPRDIRTSWQTLRESALIRPPRQRLRRANTPSKCQLRLVHDHKSTPSPSSTTQPSARTSSSASPTSSPAPQPSSPFTLKQLYNGSSFFDGWNFWSYGDPTGGVVNYLDSATAWSSGLVSINGAGNAVIKVDTTPVVSGNRNSIRIQSQIDFNGGLLMLDAVHMPHGCGTWPAFWTNGPNWPYNGEIDIIEGVHESTQNLVSLHTNNGCNVASNTGSSGVSVNGNSCSATSGVNTGCGERVTAPNSYGSAFNSVNGGVYALLWDTTGLSTFWFPRGSIPSDITNNAPLPKTWGTPVARFPASACNPYQYFVNQTIIFDTTLCGTWAGTQGTWDLAGFAGQGASCASSTGVSSCQDFVKNHGGAFADAYWEIKSLKLFQ